MKPLTGKTPLETGSSERVVCTNPGVTGESMGFVKLSTAIGESAYWRDATLRWNFVSCANRQGGEMHLKKLEGFKKGLKKVFIVLCVCKKILFIIINSIKLRLYLSFQNIDSNLLLLQQLEFNPINSLYLLSIRGIYAFKIAMSTLFFKKR